MKGALAFLRRDWDETAARFVDWSWERLAFGVGAVVVALTVVSVAADVARRVS